MVLGLLPLITCIFAVKTVPVTVTRILPQCLTPWTDFQLVGKFYFDDRRMEWIKFIFVEYSGALNCNESRPDRMSAKTAVLALNFAASAFNSNQMPKVLAVCISLNCISICVNCEKHSCWFLFVHSLPATCSHHSIQCVPFLGSDTNIVQPDAFIQTRTLALYIL